MVLEAAEGQGVVVATAFFMAKELSLSQRSWAQLETPPGIFNNLHVTKEGGRAHRLKDLVHFII